MSHSTQTKFISEFRLVLSSQSIKTALKKLNLTQQKKTRTNKPKDTIAQNNLRLKSGLVALYNDWPEKRYPTYSSSSGLTWQYSGITSNKQQGRSHVYSR